MTKPDGLARRRLVSGLTWAICLLWLSVIVLQHRSWLWAPILGLLFAMFAYPGTARIGRLLHLPPWRPHEIAEREDARRRHHDSK
jgi:hypothetical protein